jgi:hypothetical protein
VKVKAKTFNFKLKKFEEKKNQVSLLTFSVCRRRQSEALLLSLLLFLDGWLLYVLMYFLFFLLSHTSSRIYLSSLVANSDRDLLHYSFCFCFIDQEKSERERTVEIERKWEKIESKSELANCRNRERERESERR